MTGERSLGASRAHVALPAVGDRWSAARVSPAERDLLRGTVGAVLRAERIAAGYGTRRLALAIGCARSTVQRLEAGQLRPRECTLRYLARALAPDDPRPLGDRLVQAAGELLRPDTSGAIRQRQAAANRALVAGRMPLPAELDRRIRLHRAASACRQRAGAILDRPGALDDPAQLAEAQQLLEESRRLRDQAGPSVTIYAGKAGRITAGWWA